MAATEVEIQQVAARGRASAPSGGLLKVGFVAPTLLFLLAMNLFPLVYSMVMSFTDAPISATAEPTAWVGLDNYRRIFSGDASFAAALWTTAAFALLAVGIELALGFVLAMALRDRLRMPGRAVILTLLLIPMMLSPVVMGTFWRLILDSRYGILNQFLAALRGGGLGEQPGWLLDGTLQFVTVVAIDVWMWTPFMMLIALAGLNAVPRHLYEAAEIDRASPWTVFRRITLPACLPLLILAVLLRLTDAIKQFDLVMAIAGPDRLATQTLSVKLYQVMFTGEGQLGLGLAYALVVLVPVIAVAVLFTRYMDRLQGGRR